MQRFLGVGVVLVGALIWIVLRVPLALTWPPPPLAIIGAAVGVAIALWWGARR